MTAVGHLWVDVARELQKTQGFEPVLWSGARSSNNLFVDNEKAVRGAFPNCRFYHAMDLYLLKRAAQDIPKHFVDLGEMKHDDFELMEALIMLSRQDPSGADLGLQDRFRYYHAQLSMWRSLFAELKPDLVFMPEIPHTLSDYACMQVARSLGIPHAFAYFSKFRKGILFTADIHKKNSFIDPLRIEGGPIQPDAEAYVAKLRSLRYEVPEIEKSYFSRGDRASEIGWALSWFLRLGWIFLKGTWYQEPYIDFLTRESHLDRARGGSTVLREHLRRYGYGRMALRSKRFYLKHQTQPDTERPYVYFAANYQPERTTSPDAGVFVDLVYLLRLVRAGVPHDIPIYFKEHPRSFDPMGKGPWSRDKLFYRELLSLPNVKLIPTSIDSFTLIDKAVCTVTATGSVGIEAPLRGKPAIVWGTPWYHGLDGSFRVGSLAEFKSAYARVTAGYEIDQGYNLRFLSAIREREGDAYSIWNQRKNLKAKAADEAGYQAKVEDLAERFMVHLREQGEA